jgi:hypothetical protein
VKLAPQPDAFELLIVTRVPVTMIDLPSIVAAFLVVPDGCQQDTAE